MSSGVKVIKELFKTDKMLNSLVSHNPKFLERINM